jgi:hypothetical protein
VTVYTTDSFNRTNSTTNLSTTDGSGTKDALTWTQDAGTWGINSNQAYTSASTANSIARVDTTFADVTVQATFATLATSMGLLFRFSATTDYWRLTSTSAGALSLVKRVAGVDTTVVTFSTTLVAGDTLKVIAQGSSIRCFRNNTLLGTATTDSFNSTATKHGLWNNSNTTARFDSFEVDNVQVIFSVTQTQTVTPNRRYAIARTTLTKTQTQTPTIPRGTGRSQTLTVTQTQTMPLGVDALPGNHTVSPTGTEATPTYDIKIVDMRGTLVTDLTLAEPDTITWTLNQPDEFSFHFPKGAYTNTDLGVLVAGGGVSEAQIYRNSILQTWGPIIQASGSGSDGKVTMHGSGVDWYLNRRFVDGTITNLLTNGDFESGASGWATANAVTVTSDTTQYQTGSKSIKLVSTAGANAYIGQTVAPQPNGEGLLVILSGWHYIESFTGNINQSALGLYFEGVKDGHRQGLPNYYPIDSGTPRNKWIKTPPIHLWVPPNESWQFNIRVYGVGGTIYWDDLKFVVMYSTSTPGDSSGHFPPVDVGDIVRMLVSSVQDESRGKSNLRIGTHAHTVGIKQARSYQWVDHVQFDQAIREFIERDDGFDYYVDYTPTTRTFFQFSAKRGTDRHASITLKFVSGDNTSNCVDYQFDEDAGQCITRQVMLGDDNGPDREQGDYADASNVAGIVLEDVRQAPQGSKVDSLQPFARERVRRYGRAVPRTITMKVKGDTGYVNTLVCGDLVTIHIGDGWVSV